MTARERMRFASMPVMGSRFSPLEASASPRVVVIARVVFYVLSVMAASFAIGAGFAGRAWREPLLQLGWYFLGGACVALVMLLIFTRIARDKPDQPSTLFVDSRP